MDVKRVLREAWEAVEAAGIPDSLHPVAFEQAVHLVAGTRPTRTANPIDESTREQRASEAVPDSRKVAGESSGSAALIVDEDTFFATFASESKVDEEKLRKAYFVKDGRPRIALSKSKLGSTEADRNRTVATLLAGVRWYVDGKPSVGIGEIRDAATSIPYEVTRNLAKHLESVPGTMTVGAKSDKAVRVQSAKFDEPFGALIERLIVS